MLVSKDGITSHSSTSRGIQNETRYAGLRQTRTAMLAVMVTLGALIFAEPSHAAACVNGVYRAGCVGPNGVWGFASHTRTVTVMGTTVRLVAPTGPTERGASDPMGLRSSAGHISGNNSVSES